MSDPSSRLVAAILAGDEREVAAALAAGASPAHVTSGRKTVYRDDLPVLGLAAWLGHAAIVERLLAAGASIRARAVDWRCHPFSDDDTPSFEETPLAFAAQAGHIAVVAMLLTAGADPDESGPIIHAAARGHRDIVQALHAAGASLDAADGDSYSSLYHAARGGHLAVLRWLHEHGGRFHSRRDLAMARKRGPPEVIAWLNQRDRVLLRRQFSFWRAGVPPEALVPSFAALSGALRGEALTLGPAGVEGRSHKATMRVDRMLFADWEERIHEIRYPLGSLTLLYTRAERHPDPGGVPDRIRERCVLEEDRSIFMSAEAGLVLVGMEGDSAAVDAFDARLDGLSVGFSLTALGDDDSEYNLRSRLKSTK